MSAGQTPNAGGPSPVAGSPTSAIPPGGLTDHSLEAYKLLADMLKQEESAFWTRNQTFLTLNSALIVILVGVLALLSKSGGPSTPTAPVTTQSVPPPVASPASITVQQIVNQPAAVPAGPESSVLRRILVGVCLAGAALCLLWTMMITRSQGMNDYIVAYMKQLEVTYLPGIEIMRKYDELFDRKEVSFQLEVVRLRWWGTLARIFTIWVTIAGVFATLWIVLALVIGFSLV
jgi:hypothetical protein